MRSLFTCAWKSKKDNKVITIVNSSYCSSENTVTFKDEEGDSYSISEKQFLEDFESVTINYQDYKDQIAELCNLNHDFAKLGNIVARRLDPDYFVEGAYVYFDYSGAHLFNSSDDKYNIERRLGPEYPFKIISINKKELNWYSSRYENCRPYLTVNLVRKGKKMENEYREYDYSIPMFLDRLEPNDAYWLLRRYDKPY